MMIPSFFRVRHLDVTGSTNDDAKKAAEAGEAEGLVIHALRQTAGRGRMGRTWESPEGNLHFSILLRPQCSPVEAGYFSFAAALALHDAVLDFMPSASMQLKWPNDVLIEGKKVGGVLLETSLIENKKVDWLVIGVGMNLAHCPETALYPTTSLLNEGAVPDVDKALMAFLYNFNHWRLTLHHDGFRPVRRAWLADAKTGSMTVRLPQGEIHGDFASLDENGGLILRLADGAEKVVDAGDVFFP